MQAPNPGEYALLALSVIGVVIDFRTSKIPNLLTFPLAALGIIYNAYVADEHLLGAAYAIAGWLTGAIIVVAFSYLPFGGKGEKLGMGDAKLLAAVGAFTGWVGALLTFFYFCLSFGVISVIVIGRAVPWNRVFTAAFASASGAPPQNADNQVANLDNQRLERAKKKPIPAAFAIWTGALITILFRRETLDFLGFGGN